MIRIRALPLLGSLVLLACTDHREVEPAPAAETPAPVVETPALDLGLFERVAVIGASASDGSFVGMDLGEDVRFATILEEAVRGEATIAYDGAHLFFFTDAEGKAAETIPQAVEVEPTLVVAPDFLFWFFYGSAPSVERRLARLEEGLAWLERFDCPILVGDVPDMRGAEGKMIPSASMPPPESFAAANARITEWAAEDPDRVLLPLFEHNRNLASGEAFEVHGYRWDPDEHLGLLLDDELHPNLEGSAILCLMMLGCLAEAQGASLDGVVIRDPEEIAEAVIERFE